MENFAGPLCLNAFYNKHLSRAQCPCVNGEGPITGGNQISENAVSASQGQPPAQGAVGAGGTISSTNSLLVDVARAEIRQRQRYVSYKWGAETNLEHKP